MNLCDIKTIRDIMSIYNLTFRKEFGQNFLTNRAVVEDIADSCCSTPDATILEIGPGIGTLTQYLAEAAREVVAVEILSSRAVEEVTSGAYDLSLFTCTYYSTNRVVLCCDRVETD